jgi:predicted Abi (CAAX) family protease
LGRISDGSVEARVIYAPPSNSLGLAEGAAVLAKWILPDTWKRADGTSVISRDVFIPEGARKAAREKKKRDVFPWALHGWKGVSALESLAAARVLDPEGKPSGDAPIDIRVALNNATFSGGILAFSEAPVVVEGTHVALLKFDSFSETSRRGVVTVKATQYDAGQKSFTAPVSSELEFGSHAPLPTQEQDIPAFDPAGIVASPFNALGWYAFGKPNTLGGKKTFVISALEPRAVTAIKENFDGELNVRLVEQGKAAEYFKSEAWTDPEPSLGFKNEPTSEPILGVVRNNTLRRAAIGGTKSERDWELGDKGLLVHVFSWRGKPDPKSSKPRLVPNAVTGHFAFGTATVVESPFVPGEKKFNIDYHQVYGQGPDAIPAASQTWPAYMGSLQRGIGFQVPVSDFVVKLDDLTNEIALPNGERIVILDTLRRNLELLMALYRTGDGDGISVIDPVTSCVQDSNFALYLTFEPLLKKLGEAKAKGGTGARVDAAISLLEKLRAAQTGLIPTRPGHWQNALEKGEFKLDLTPLQRFLSIIVSKDTSIPRGSHDSLAKFFDEANATLWSMRMSQIGGGHDATPGTPWAQRPRVYGFVPDKNMLEVLLKPR